LQLARRGLHFGHHFEVSQVATRGCRQFASASQSQCV
jgi:hypothetical protein